MHILFGSFTCVRIGEVVCDLSSDHPGEERTVAGSQMAVPGNHACAWQVQNA